jgi:hypothetical protein
LTRKFGGWRVYGTDRLPPIRTAIAETTNEERYEIRDKDKRGKVREVEVSADGEVIAVE